MSYTWDDVLDEARYMLRDENGTFNWSDKLALFLANDAAELIYKIVRRIAPNLYEKSYTIPILKDSAGPYNLPADFHSVISLLDSNSKRLDKTNRDDVAPTVASVKGEPKKYYFSGRDPITVYFDRTPDADYNHTLWYSPLFVRAALTEQGAVPTTNVPLDDETRGAVREWIVKFCGIIDEYITMDEDKKIAVMLPLISGTALQQSNEMTLEIGGVGF